MAGEHIPSLIMQIMDQLGARGVLITNRGGNWRVRVKREPEETSYLADDLEDAFQHGRALAVSSRGTDVGEAIRDHPKMASASERQGSTPALVSRPQLSEIGPGT